ncbi:site-specific integrase [Mesorhizobium sp. M7D.F.Ca.US.005.01.1.1]|uniref:tyrosine-type recombinase/integrase n=1 Tax=Mesorhizobium sp. M7D.F.Ca.US.005.01.1.1 TaxID=2493678 RepID=UPI000F758B2D|nr:site-specific integrase [Mesorhizobium sp. M7D.F.Ca.US.005.01.1.1]AZO39698.1 site-specific integrase [Mesorhizobium sp. M7D.F.Ca.US.005.01.1.1]AZO45928.1 site-specific integrase [Mesorhizobium sp. M7D.F.Ca.US.005.01.1.1]
MPLKIYRRGEIWHYRGTVAGRRVRGSTQTSIKARALEIAAERETREWKSSHHGPESVLTFADAAMLYRQADRSTRFLEPIEDYWKDTPVKQINAGAVRQSAIVLHPKTSGATRNRQVIVPTQAIINHAAGMDLCHHLKIERFNVATKSKEPVTWDWVQKFMAVSSPHLGALACFMFLTGARISEALDLRWGDVSLAERRALIRQTKIGAERRPHLPQALVAAIANIPSNRETSAKVFQYSSRDTAKPLWRAAIRRAKIKPLTYHACRHGFATAMLHAGVDPITVAKLGGWKDAKHVFTTYGHAMTDETLADRITGQFSGQIIVKKAELG